MGTSTTLWEAWALKKIACWEPEEDKDSSTETEQKHLGGMENMGEIVHLTEDRRKMA